MTVMDHDPYDDEYATCARTYATVRIYGIPPDHVSRVLGLEPTKTQFSSLGSPTNPPRQHGWFLSSKDVVSSRDVRRHVDWCLDQLVPKATELAALRKDGAQIDVFCYWRSASGQGGPTISPTQAAKLAALDLDCGFDVYLLRERSARD